MKRTVIAAAALLLGTSALTAASAQNKFDKEAILAAKKLTLADFADKGIIAMKHSAAAKVGVPHTGMGGPLEEVDELSIVTKPGMASGHVKSDSLTLAKLEAAAAMKAADAAGVGGPLEEVESSAEAEKWASTKVETNPVILAKWDQAAALKARQAAHGMGGPLEADDGVTDLAGLPAAGDYPPCSPGPGDDRCIQLYEPGVRAQLASWDQSTDLADHSVTAAVGGPYEPVEDLANEAELTMNGDGLIDSGLGETIALNGDVDFAQHSEFAGVGGPVEAQSGYPPCSPGPGDDRCIQLYEPGVSGAGN